MGLLWGGLQSKTNSCAERVWELKRGRGGLSKKLFGGFVTLKHMLYNLLNVCHNAAVLDGFYWKLDPCDWWSYSWCFLSPWTDKPLEMKHLILKRVLGGSVHEVCKSWERLLGDCQKLKLLDPPGPQKTPCQLGLEAYTCFTQVKPTQPEIPIWSQWRCCTAGHPEGLTAILKCLFKTFSVSSSLQDQRSRWVWEVGGSRSAQINSARSSTLQTASTVGQKFGSFSRFSPYSSIKQPYMSTKAG